MKSKERLVKELNTVKATQTFLQEKILDLCNGQYLSLGEISEALGKSKNTIRAGYLYPMVKSGQLTQEHPAGTKSAQRYKSSNKRQQQLQCLLGKGH